MPSSIAGNPLGEFEKGVLISTNFQRRKVYIKLQRRKAALEATFPANLMDLVTFAGYMRAQLFWLKLAVQTSTDGTGGYALEDIRCLAFDAPDDLVLKAPTVWDEETEQGKTKGLS